MEDEAKMCGYGGSRSSKAVPKDGGVTIRAAINAMQLGRACLAASWALGLMISRS